MSDWTGDRDVLARAGFVAPLPLAQPERVDAVLRAHAGDKKYTKNLHRDSPSIANLLNDPGLVDAVAALCGAGLTLWRSALFQKAPGSEEIGWHHDKHFHDEHVDDIALDATGSHFSVLIALTDMTQAIPVLRAAFTPETLDGDAMTDEIVSLIEALA